MSTTRATSKRAAAAMLSAVEESPVPAKAARAKRNKIDAGRDANGDEHVEAASHGKQALSDDLPSEARDPKSSPEDHSGEEDDDDEEEEPEEGSKVNHRRVAIAFVEGWAASQVDI
jgi:hypothetical protein